MTTRSSPSSSASSAASAVTGTFAPRTSTTAMSDSGAWPRATTRAGNGSFTPETSTRSTTGSFQERLGSTTCAFVRTYVRSPSRAKATPDALRTTSPAAAMWMRTALGKTFWTVEERGFPPWATPARGATATRVPAATTTPAATATSRFVSTSSPTGKGGKPIPGGFRRKFLRRGRRLLRSTGARTQEERDSARGPGRPVIRRVSHVFGEAAAFLDRTRRSSWTDLALVAGVGGAIFGVVRLAQEWSGVLRPAVQIDLSLAALPGYAFLSLSRGLAAYALP